MAERITVRVDKPVHGGHGIARHEGRVVFVRHAAPGELVTVELTEQGKIWRGDAVAVHEPHPGRVPVTWEAAGPGGVGAELAHLTLPAQREWKRAVIVDALERIGRQRLPVQVLPVGDGDGWHTRTRIELTTDPQGRAGMFAHRSHTHVPLQRMPLAHERLNDLDLFNRMWPANTRITAVGPSGDAPVALIDGAAPAGHPGTVRERVHGYEYVVDANGFWQVHHRAPTVLSDAVLEGVGDVRGKTVLDLYSGAGLFTLPLADAVDTGRVHSIEGSRRAVRNAVQNTEGRTNVHLHQGDVGRILATGTIPARADVVVLDPPRVGARRSVMEEVLARKPERIVYVSCDPAALARDLATALEGGYAAGEVTGYDVFPHTHHIEAVAVLTPRGRTKQ